MAQLPEVFNTDDHEEMKGFEPLPIGVYTVAIIKSEMNDTKAGDGKYLSLQFKVLEGEHAKRYVFTNLNLINPSQEAVEIAQRELKSICVACGIEGELEDSVDLHDIPLGLKLGIKASTAEWPASNTIKKYYAEADIPEDEGGTPFEK